MGQQFVAQDSIRGIATAVSVTEEVITKAGATGSNLLIVHHGLMWNTEPRTLDERQKGRVRALNQNNITLLAYHLALDVHPLIGNNAQAIRQLGAQNLVPFAELGWGGEIEDKMYRYHLDKKLEEMYPKGTINFLSGTYPIKKVCAITGSGGSFIHQAKKEGYDLLLTGEAEEPSKALAAELGIHFVAAGHYETEKAGVIALGEYIGETFDLPCVFIQDDNPI
jgi:dinuclear metal center YbgI/SA1388 family protein